MFVRNIYYFDFLFIDQQNPIDDKILSESKYDMTTKFANKENICYFSKIIKCNVIIDDAQKLVLRKILSRNGVNRECRYSQSYAQNNLI